MKILTNLNLSQNMILNAALENLTEAPTSPVVGQVYFNTINEEAYVYNGTNWISLTTAAIGHNTALADGIVPMGGGHAQKVWKTDSAGNPAWRDDSDTQYTVGSGISLTGTEFSVSAGNGLTQSTSGLVLGTPSSITETSTNSATATSHTHAIDSSIATKTYVDGLLSASDAMVFKGTLGTSGTTTVLPTTYAAGWTYKVITAGTYAGNVCEIGDMVIAIVDRSGTGNINADWIVLQTNIDGAVTGPTSATDNRIATFDGTSGKIIKDGGQTISEVIDAAVVQVGTIGDGTLTVSGSTDLSGSGTFSANQTDSSSISISHANITRTNTTSSETKGFGDSFTVVDTVTTNARGHITGVNTKTVTLSGAKKFAADVGNGSSTNIVVTHNLGTEDVSVAIREKTGLKAIVYTDIEITSTNTITLRFATAPSASQYRVVVVG